MLNEAPRIGRMLASAADADYRLVVDTGSTDNSRAVALAAGAHSVPTIAVRAPFRFDIARNAALALLPADADVAICLEADEVLADGWREEVERAWMPGTTQLSYMFRWDGGTTFRRDRIHARHGYYWHGWTHEGLYPDPQTQVGRAHVDAVLVIDMPPDGRCGSPSYLGQLHSWARAEPYNTRAAFYHARELAFAGRLADAAREFERFLSLPGLWSVEVEYAQRWLGRAHGRLCNLAVACEWHMQSVASAPRMRCPLVWFAETMLLHGRPHQAGKLARQALAITARSNEFTEDPISWGPRIDALASL
jgi:glycosyltransferase involved in cell wall biosynthesis